MARSLIALAFLLAACGSAAAGPSGSPSPTAPANVVQVTNEDHGKTVPVAVGQLVQVSLGDNLDWTLDISDTTILSPVPGVNTLVRGTQLLARAHKAGTVVIEGQGRPRCAPQQPCIMLLGIFKTTIVVR